MRAMTDMLKSLGLLVLCAPLAACAEIDPQQNIDLLELPEGFTATIYAEGVENARQMALAPGGTLFVGSRRAGKVHAVVDADGDQRADRVVLIDEGLKMPSGVAFRDGALYVGALDRVLRYDDIENRLDDPPEPVLALDGLPDEEHHGWKYLRFAPDGRLFIPVGAPCNICDEPGFAEIRRVDLDSGEMDTWAEGVRNSVGLAFHLDTGELWFTDNGRDWMGDDLPQCELNHAPEQGMHFGYPYCHQGDVPDPEFGGERACVEFTEPVLNLGPHVAPLGLLHRHPVSRKVPWRPVHRRTRQLEPKRQDRLPHQTRDIRGRRRHRPGGVRQRLVAGPGRLGSAQRRAGDAGWRAAGLRRQGRRDLPHQPQRRLTDRPP